MTPEEKNVIQAARRNASAMIWSSFAVLAALAAVIAGIIQNDAVLVPSIMLTVASVMLILAAARSMVDSHIEGNDETPGQEEEQ